MLFYIPLLFNKRNKYEHFGTLFGRKEKNSSNIQGVLVANAEIDNPLSLVVVFDTLPENNSKELTRLLRNYHSSMKQATCELVPELDFWFSRMG